MGCTWHVLPASWHRAINPILLNRVLMARATSKLAPCKGTRQGEKKPAASVRCQKPWPGKGVRAEDLNPTNMLRLREPQNHSKSPTLEAPFSVSALYSVPTSITLPAGVHKASAGAHHLLLTSGGP